MKTNRRGSVTISTKSQISGILIFVNTGPWRRFARQIELYRPLLLPVTMITCEKPGCFVYFNHAAPIPGKPR
jgi:hypothetical protein